MGSHDIAFIKGKMTGTIFSLCLSVLPTDPHDTLIGLAKNRTPSCSSAASTRHKLLLRGKSGC